MPCLIVPKTKRRGELATKIRHYFEERFPNSEKVENVVLVNERVYVKIGWPTLHENPYHRIEYETQQHNLSYDLVVGVGNMVMEG